MIVLGAIMMVLGVLGVLAAFDTPPGRMGGLSMALGQSGFRGWDERSASIALGAIVASLGGLLLLLGRQAK